MEQSRRFYRELNKLSATDVTKDEVGIIEPEHNVVVREDNLADFFNRRFASQGERVSRSVSAMSVEDFQSGRTLNSMYLYPTSLDEIHCSIADLKIGKASGIDELSAEVLKISALAIVPYLQKLINQTFSPGEFPDCLKIAKVFPLFISGSKADVDIYRSISLLPVLSKVLEKIMYNRLIKFFDKNDILYEKQFGFRSKHSTVDALIEITENIRSGTDEEFTSIMLDLRKAFDTINHYRLVEKLSQCGVRGIVNKWFQSYLSNRKQAVFVNNKWSNFEPINCGVPQGSILGPLLFIIYINEFPKSCPNVTTQIFADDANLIYSKKKSLTSRLDKELMKVPSWMSFNKLAVNIPKTQMLQFNDTSNVQFMGVNLVNDESTKYLATHTDPKPSFHSHIKHVMKKLSKQLSVIARLRHYVPRGILLKYYQNEPIITWFVGLWLYIKTSVEPQLHHPKKVLRLVHFKPQFHRSRELFFQNGFFNVFELYAMELLKFCLKSVRGENCSYFPNSFHKTRINVHETRSVSSGAFYHLRTSNLREEQTMKDSGSKVLNYFIANYYSTENLLQWSGNQLMHKVREAKKSSCPETLAQLIFRSLRNYTNKCFNIDLELSGPLSKRLRHYRGSSTCAYAGYFFQVYLSVKMRMWNAKSFFLSFLRLRA